MKLDLLPIHDEQGNYLINLLDTRDVKVLNCVANHEGDIVTIYDMSNETGLAVARVLSTVEGLIESGLISLSTPIDDFIALNQQNKSPIFTLHLENTAQAIKYFQSKGR